jgi:ADP-ribose pyrophosphatase YjhB (NUDIX family)
VDGRALLIRRGSEPLKGQWSIPGGTLELGETLADGVCRELLEETGLRVRVLELIEVFERIIEDDSPGGIGHPRYHFVIADYLCVAEGGEPQAGSDVTELAFVTEDELSRYQLTPTATRILKKAFAMRQARK